MTIKTGDLVMVVKPTPCCGNCKAIGRTFTVKGVSASEAVCRYCGRIDKLEDALSVDDRRYDISRLKKIDPPADGDSLPTRADIEVAA